MQIGLISYSYVRMYESENDYKISDLLDADESNDELVKLTIKELGVNEK
jgi:hypothetical protein